MYDWSWSNYTNDNDGAECDKIDDEGAVDVLFDDELVTEDI